METFACCRYDATEKEGDRFIDFGRKYQIRAGNTYNNQAPQGVGGQERESE